LPNPTLQTPSLLLFLGRRSKNITLRQLFPHNNFKRHSSKGVLNIQINTSLTAYNNPIIFTDGDFTSAIPSYLAPTSCYKSTTYIVAWQPPSEQSIINAIFACIVLPFITVLTVFINNFNSIK
ncbi:hypothetical protein V2W45_1240481, partial [Cenococcum geophilum]